MELLLIWLLFGILSAVVASNKGRSVGGWFLAGILLGPFGLILALLVSKNQVAIEKEAVRAGEMKKCLYCAEFIKAEAIKCRFCGESVAPPHADEQQDVEPLKEFHHPDAVAIQKRLRRVRSSVRVNPRDPDRWVALGDVFTQKGELEKARDCYRHALQLTADHRGAEEGLVRLEEIEEFQLPQKATAGMKLSFLLVIIIVCVFAAFVRNITTEKQSTAVTKVSSSSEKVTENSSNKKFEASIFCKQYACKDEGKLEYPDGCTEYYYTTNLSRSNAEASVVTGDECQNRSYHLRLEALDVDNDPGDRWEDPQIVFDFLESVTGKELDAAIQGIVTRKLEESVSEHVCNATPIDVGEYKAWVGQVPRLQQTVLVAKQCK